jgi:hypothetical protein
MGKYHLEEGGNVLPDVENLVRDLVGHLPCS